MYHVRNHYNMPEQTKAVLKVRESTYELCEFLLDVIKIEDLEIELPHKEGIHSGWHEIVRTMNTQKAVTTFTHNYQEEVILKRHISQSVG